jgi:hypothetical protein
MVEVTKAEKRKIHATNTALASRLNFEKITREITTRIGHEIL